MKTVQITETTHRAIKQLALDIRTKIPDAVDCMATRAEWGKQANETLTKLCNMLEAGSPAQRLCKSLILTSPFVTLFDDIGEYTPPQPNINE